ncbi:MAG: CBS domain-containing protein [Planctomycetaceae bacterium]
MRTDVVTMPATGTVRDAAVILSRGGFHSVPVVDGTRLAGIVTSTDLIHYLVEQY